MTSTLDLETDPNALMHAIWRVRDASNRFGYSSLLNLGVPEFTESTITLMDEETLADMGRRTAFDDDGTLLWQDADGTVLARVAPSARGLYQLPTDAVIVLERLAA